MFNVEINQDSTVTIDDLMAPTGPQPANLFRQTKFLKLVEETGEFLISYYGAQMALGFKGDLNFIRRCYNWAENTGVVGKGASLHWFYDENGKMAYVCPPTKEHIRNGLILQFRAEIIYEQEVKPLREEWSDDNGLMIEYDEVAVESLAAQRADDFIANRLVPDCFLVNNPRNIGHVYTWSLHRETDNGE